MFRKIILCCFLITFTSFPALAEDLVATFRYSNGQIITISTRDEGHIRMDMDPNSYMLLNGEKIYSINKDEDGRWNVLDMDQMRGMSKLSGFLGNKTGRTNMAALSVLVTT